MTDVVATRNVRDLIDRILQEKRLRQKDIRVNPISTEGANYTTALYVVTVTTDDEELELFVKVAILVGEIRNQMNADGIYQTESFVYETLADVYDGLQDKHAVAEEDRFVFPKCYGLDKTVGRETVVLENLTVKGYESYNRFDCMDWEHAAVSVELLAKFHALSFAYDKDKPQEFKDLADKMVHRARASDEPPSEKMIAVWMDMVQRAVDVLEEEYKERVRDQMMQPDLNRKYNRPIGKPVLCHGDYRLSNILFRREGTRLRAIPVDYQLVYSGCPASDLVYFIFVGSDEEFRRQHLDRLLDHYYEQLAQALRRLDVDPVEAYPRETFDDHFKQSLPYALFVGVVFLPIVLVDEAAAPDMAGADVSAFVVTPNTLFRDRFRGIVRDCVRWGVI